jgi:SAM-dependent methyltransferase
VTSYQTLEHVQDVEAVLAEMLRVVRPGGIIHLRCPDYRGTFEGHYLMPWLPLMPRGLARLYLRLRGRPTKGFAGIVYTTRPRLVRGLQHAAAHAGAHIEVVDLERERVRARLKNKGLPSSALFVTLAKAALYMRRAFRAETQINLRVVKQPG